MRFYSPLRYPGGKNKLAKFIASICVQNNVNGQYIEPYAGGASVALYLLVNNYVKEITINDLDRSIYAFWYSIINNTEEFCNMINETEINIKNWHIQKKIQKSKNRSSLLKLGFSTFFLNRTNRSGIIDGGTIGGLMQKGNYKINCRFNKKDLIERIKLISTYKNDINLYNLDALKLIKQIQKKSKNKNTIFYFDPPYFLKGQSLYMNSYKMEDHKDLITAIKKIKNSQWIVSYDDVSQIQLLYKGIKMKRYSFTHTAYKPREGKELLFFSNNLNYIPRGNPTKVMV